MCIIDIAEHYISGSMISMHTINNGGTVVGLEITAEFADDAVNLVFTCKYSSAKIIVRYEMAS